MILGQQSNSDMCELNEAQRCYIVDEQRSVLCIPKVSKCCKSEAKAAKTERTECRKKRFSPDDPL